ncbi:MAG: DNA cytosine methyltransferase [Candidatus Altimarinota bacterium]
MITIDLFAGCGGLSLGFQNAGFNIIAAFDNWDPAIEIYSKNFDHPIIKYDLSNTEDTSLFEKYSPSLIIGGPPCQDFSSAGKRDETGGRADLTMSFARIIKNVKPKWFVMENVDRILKSNILKEAIKEFKEANYGLTYKVLDASFCGAPQKRKRFFMIGELNGEDGFLELYFEKNFSKKPMTIKDYLGNSLGIEHYYRHPRNYNRRGIFSINEPSPTIRGVNRPLPKGYKGHSADSAAISKDIRPLTTIERSYIQTFPKTFKWTGGKTALEQLIGNAVPVKLAEFVGKCLQEYISDKNNNSARLKPRQLTLDAELNKITELQQVI